jgi:hypothetical protein
MNVIILGKDDFPELNYLEIHHKTDYLKAKLVLENGGFWIDADMVVMKDLNSLVKIVEQKGFAGIPGFFGAKKGNKLVKRWVDGMDKLLKEKITFSDLIQPLLKDPKFEEFKDFTKEMICPIYHTGEEFWKLFDDLDIEKYSTENNYIFTLYNSQFSKEFKEDDSSKSSGSNRLRKRRRSSKHSGIDKKTSQELLKTQTQRIAQTNSAIKLTNFDLANSEAIFEEPADDGTSVTFD